LFIFQLPAAKLLEVFAHYANTGKETLSPFVDSSIDKVLLQTNAGCTRLYQSLLDFTKIPKLYLDDTLLHDSQTL